MTSAGLGVSRSFSPEAGRNTWTSVPMPGVECMLMCPSWRLNNRMGDGEPESHAFLGTPLLRTEVGVEDPRQILFGNPHPMVLDGDSDVFARIEGRHLKRLPPQQLLTSISTVPPSGMNSFAFMTRLATSWWI